MNTLISASNFQFSALSPRPACCLFVALLIARAPAEPAQAEDALASRISGTCLLYQPLKPVGDAPPPETENLILAAELDKIKAGGLAPSLLVLEQFICDYPNSSWVPSLRANLGRYYREHGRYSLALRHWEAAWAATRDAHEGPAKAVADFTFAYWTQLLASLGLADTLRSLFQETKGRAFDAGPLQQIINDSKEGYHLMLTDPGACFQCGTYALHNVARALARTNCDTGEIDRLPSPATGFSMTVVATRS
jgi:hypothetical protein